MQTTPSTRVREGLRLFAALLLVLIATPVDADIVINEIHYAPRDLEDPSIDRPDLEWIELLNDGPEPYDLSGYYFSAGITYTFPEGTFIDGRGFLVVCRDAAAAGTAYGLPAEILLGDFGGVLDNSGEKIELANPQGLPMASVRYNDRGQWPSGAAGTGHSLSLENPYRDFSDPDRWTLSREPGGTPGRTNFITGTTILEETLVADDEVWRYFKGTEAPPADWQTVGFDDSGWLSGPTGIGYGDGDDRTVLDDMQNGYLTVFCRHTFSVDDPGALIAPVLAVICDDGFIATLNGVEVARSNVSGSNFDDPANDAIEPELTEVPVDPSVFQAGANVLAVSVHNAGSDSSDVSFIPKLTDRRTIEPEADDRVPVLINEGHFRADSGRFIELYNTSDSPVDLSGLFLTDDFAVLDRYRIPDGTMIPARGFLAFDQVDLGFDLAIAPGLRDRVSCALTSSDGRRVVDARIFEPAFDGASEARYPDGDEKFSPAAVPTPGAPNEVDVVRDVIFNEIHYHPISNDSEDEFIEFFNRGDTAQDLSGFLVDGVDFIFPDGTMIGPGQYLVIARSPERIRTTYGLDSSVVIDPGWDGQLRNGGERLLLLDSRGNIAATLRYGDGGEWTRWADGRGSSLERIDPFGEESAPTTWDASDDSAAVETVTFEWTGRHGGGESDLGLMLMTEGIALVDDIEIVRSGATENLVRNGTFESDTSTWRIEGTHSRSGRTSAAGERLSGNGSLKLIAWNGDGDYKVNRVECDTGPQTGTMSLRLRARWVIGGRALLAIGDYNTDVPENAGIARSLELPIPAALGTPGRINSVTLREVARSGRSNVGPGIESVEHSPPVPGPNEDVTVTARVHDPGGVALVRLRYRPDTVSGAFIPVDMAGPDSGGRYRATIPGLPLGTRIHFYIEAIDTLGAQTRFPRDLVRATHPPVVDPNRPGSQDFLYCTYRHDDPVLTSGPHQIRFFMSDENEAELLGRRVLSNQMLEGTFVFGNEDVYYNAQIRFAGSPWLRPGGDATEKSYAVKAPKDEPFHGRKRGFNLDEHATDGRERLVHWLLRRNAGATRLPYWDRQAIVRFALNDLGTVTYELLDRPGSDYVESWFPEDDGGDLYEMDDRFSFSDSGDRTGNAEGHVLSPPYGNTAGASNKENYRWYFALRGREGDDDFEPIMGLCRFMDWRLTHEPVFDAEIFDQIDVEEFLRVWAVELNIDDWDTWGGERGKNCYFYRSPADGRWRLIPWDLELTFEDVNANSMPAEPESTYENHFSEITRMINRPRIKRFYYGILADMIGDAFSSDPSSPLATWMNSLSGTGVTLGGSADFIATRSEMIRGWISPAMAPNVELRITTGGGGAVQTEESFIDLAGEAPAELVHLVIARNGQMLDPAPEFRFDGPSITTWTLRAPLLAGTNEIEVLGFAARGELGGADSIFVVSGEPFGKPVIASITPDPAAVGEEIEIAGEEFHDGLSVVFDGDIVVSDPTFDEATDATAIRVVVPNGVAGDSSSVEVVNIDGQRSDPYGLGIRSSGPRFVRGDTNTDGRVDISDAIATLGYLFLGRGASCLDALDSDDDGSVLLTDAVVILQYLFRAGPAPAQPFPSPGIDPTADDLGCEGA